MDYWIFLVSALLLSFERIAYFWVSHHPDWWADLCNKRVVAQIGAPTIVLHKLFYGFKIIQIGVFLGWCMLHAESLFPTPTATAGSWVVGGALVACGMLLNYSVFQRLGSTGVFYGRELGFDVAWVQGFPFSAMRHPQYVGSILSIWGFFLIMRYPNEDWLVLPLLETVYYVIGARYEP